MLLTTGLALKGLGIAGNAVTKAVISKKHREFMQELQEKELQSQWEMRRKLQEQQIQEARAAAKLVADQQLAIFEEQSFLEFWPLLDSPVKLRRDFSKALENGHAIPLQIIIPTDTRVLHTGGNDDLQEAMTTALTDLATFMSANYAHREGNAAAAKVYTNCIKRPQQGYGTSQLHSIYEVFHMAPTLILNPYCQGDLFCVNCSYWDGSDLEKQWTPSFFGPVFNCSITEFRRCYLAEKVERWKKIRNLQAVDDPAMDALAALLDKEEEACETARRNGVDEEGIAEFILPRFSAEYARLCEPLAPKIRAYIGGVVSDACRLCTSLFTDMHYLIHGALEPRFPRLCAEGIKRFPGCQEQVHQLFLQALEARRDDPYYETRMPLWHARLAHAYQGTSMEPYTDGHRLLGTNLLQKLLPAPKTDVQWTDVPELKQTVDALNSLMEDGEDPYVRQCLDFMNADAPTLYAMGGTALEEGDARRALDFFEHSSRMGYAPATHKLAECYKEGIGTTADSAKAAAYYREAASKGDAPSQFRLGACYESGTGVPESLPEAVAWYRKAAEQGILQAQIVLGRLYYEGERLTKDDTQAVKWFGMAAPQGDACSQYTLGLCLLNGTGSPKDEVAGAGWLRAAAEQGHADAMYQLASCCAQGLGLPVDKAAAVAWYRQAADQGHAEACYQLGKCYASGDGIPQNKGKAEECFRQAAAQQHPGAMYELGLYLLDSPEGDKAQALGLFRQAGETGHAEALYQLGACYNEGTGTTKDENQAMSYFRLAATAGHAEAQYLVGKHHWNKYLALKAKSAPAKPAEEPSPKNNTGKRFGSAIAFLARKIASSAGSAASSALASVALKLDHNRDDAKNWFQKAADQGHAAAARALAELQTEASASS